MRWLDKLLGRPIRCKYCWVRSLDARWLFHHEHNHVMSTGAMGTT